jgi:hypothetical protein
MNTLIEESNLAHIGSDEDIAIRKAAAETEVNWDGVGNEEGVLIWRVENVRDENGNAKFGISPWPVERKGEFYSGDSYIVLQTRKDENDLSGSFLYDIYFWIGSESSQDEYGVAAYKANELDVLLGDVPIQHREVQFHESNDFMKSLDNKIRYLDGGIESGFRKIDESTGKMSLPTRLFHVRRDSRVTRCVQVPAQCDSLNQNDAFILQSSDAVYTWFGESSSPFEKSKAGQVAHNIVLASNGNLALVEDVTDDNEDFWNAIGGKGDIKASANESEVNTLEEYNEERKMYILTDIESVLKVEECEVKIENLVSDDVCLLDTGKAVYVWIGSGSSKREQSQAMLLAQKHIQSMGCINKSVVRVKEGQESRVTGFKSALAY